MADKFELPQETAADLSPGQMAKENNKTGT